jgi:hypothetical protein
MANTKLFKPLRQVDQQFIEVFESTQEAILDGIDKSTGSRFSNASFYRNRNGEYYSAHLFPRNPMYRHLGIRLINLFGSYLDRYNFKSNTISIMVNPGRGSEVPHVDGPITGVRDLNPPMNHYDRAVFSHPHTTVFGRPDTTTIEAFSNIPSEELKYMQERRTRQPILFYKYYTPHVGPSYLDPQDRAGNPRIVLSATI